MTENLAVDQVNILLVDDDTRNLTALAAVLEDPDYNLVLAESGEEALNHLLKSTFAVIILDVMMPGMDGFELARLIKSRKKTENTPIIFLTAFHTDEQDIFQGYDLGAFDYLIKPAHPQILRAKVSVFANLHRKRLAEKRQYQHLLRLASGGDKESSLPEWSDEYRKILQSYIAKLRAGKTIVESPLEPLVPKLLKQRVKTAEILATHMEVVKAATQAASQTEAQVFTDYAKTCLLELLGRLVDQSDTGG
ncbi:MAG TPA: response regulator [Marinobacterium sp.]|nr:response regulator [Marinobacterium sp.]